MNIRNVALTLCIALVLILLGAWGFVSHHPDDPRVVAAERWPVVGPLVLWLRQGYTDPGVIPVRARGTATPGVETPGRPEHAPAGGRAPSRTFDRSAPRVWIPEGAVLRTAPRGDAEPIHTTRAIGRWVRLERRGDWFRTHHRGRDAWVLVPGYREDGGPPWGEATERPVPLLPEDPSADDLKAVLAGLDPDRRVTGQVGPYVLHTDVEDPALLEHLDRLAAQVEGAWVARHGRRPLGSPRSVVVLYDDEAVFRELAAAMPGLTGLDAEGFAGGGLIVFYRGDRPRADVASTLVHEIAHRIHRRALGPALPPWLDEGMADDLARSAITADGTLDPDRLGGTRHHRVRPLDGGRLVQVAYTGGLSSLLHLDLALREDRLPTLVDLVSMDPDAFVRGPDRRLHYDVAAFWVRFLVEGEDGRYLGGWQVFLDHVARGGEISTEILLDHLGSAAGDLEAAFRRWIVSQARTLTSDRRDLPADGAPRPRPGPPPTSP